MKSSDVGVGCVCRLACLVCVQDRTTKEEGGFTLYEDEKAAGQTETESGPLFPLMAGYRKRDDGVSLSGGGW